MFGWKSANRCKPNRVVETSGAFDGGATGVMSGIIAGTRIATALGWREAGAVQAGDIVLTFDGGLQRVTQVTRQKLWPGDGPVPARFWPLLLPAGATEKAVAMMILPRQGVMLESDRAEEALGDPFALIPAAAPEGGRGVEQVYPNKPVEVISLQFDADQVIFAEHGALLFCPAGGDLVQMAMQGAAQHCPYRMLPESCAMELVHGATPAADCESCLMAMRSNRAESVQGRPMAA